MFRRGTEHTSLSRHYGSLRWVTVPHRGAEAVPAAHHRLSPRELETLRHVAAGHTYLQTARAMGVSPHTVDTYLRRIRAKLDLGSTAELTRVAISLGL
ncbi:helix-turn-helix transcriptional regulator [Streptomyces actuosus]|uniref:Helix-turn-helix transcriptional regulator n=1 Tax=Streptomyces actuosus TaxID=1885 RepID=A0ABS2VW98_STRAS|nr:helix-turn-helix transcriptional regulator [Streptomyces actuosus]MBN0047398.1 helix-turn-helix transcriptional regulator [Streptomyces actuosus]